MPWSSSKASPEQCHATTCHNLARDRKQQTLELRFSRFEAMMRRAGWVARRRPLAGPSSPCGSQPAPRRLAGRIVSPNGPAGLTAGVRESRYKGSALAPCANHKRGCQGRLDRPRKVPSLSPADMSSRPITGVLQGISTSGAVDCRWMTGEGQSPRIIPIREWGVTCERQPFCFCWPPYPPCLPGNKHLSLTNALVKTALSNAATT